MGNPVSIGSFFPPIQQPSSVAPGIASNETGFSDVLKNAINQVEQLHAGADKQVSDLLQGDRADVHNVMIAVQKADVAFQLMMQMRNKIVSAYQEVEKMQF
jgi:flagellar hook-basal body complex protein FliE